MQGMLEGLQDFQSDLLTPEHVAEELKAMSLVTGGLFAVHLLLDLRPFKVSEAQHSSVIFMQRPTLIFQQPAGMPGRILSQESGPCVCADFAFHTACTNNKAVIGRLA